MVFEMFMASLPVLAYWIGVKRGKEIEFLKREHEDVVKLICLHCERQCPNDCPLDRKEKL